MTSNGPSSRDSRSQHLLPVKGHRASDTILARYNDAGFTEDLRTTAATDPRILLVGLERLYAKDR